MGVLSWSESGGMSAGTISYKPKGFLEENKYNWAIKKQDGASLGASPAATETKSRHVIALFGDLMF